MPTPSVLINEYTQKLATLQIAARHRPLSPDLLAERAKLENVAADLMANIQEAQSRRKLLPAVVETGSVKLLAACADMGKPIEWRPTQWQYVLSLNLSPEFIELMFEKGFRPQDAMLEIYLEAIEKPYLRDFALKHIRSQSFSVFELFNYFPQTGRAPEFEAMCLRTAVETHSQDAQDIVGETVSAGLPVGFALGLLAGAPFTDEMLSGLPEGRTSRISHLTSNHQRLKFHEEFGPLERFLEDPGLHLRAIDLFPE